VALPGQGSSLDGWMRCTYRISEMGRADRHPDRVSAIVYPSARNCMAVSGVSNVRPGTFVHRNAVP
jgi:hypothetical protein